MYPMPYTSRTVRWVRAGLGCVFLLLVSLTVAYSQLPQGVEKKAEEKKGMEMPKQKASHTLVKLPAEAGAVEVAFVDGSNLKMVLREEKIALDTPHGKLHIAVSDIQRIEFATRLSDEDAKQIKKSISDLGSDDYQKREAASAQLLKLREKAYPALLRAAGQNDPETVRRAQELIQQISSNVPADRLTVRPKDVVYTSDSMIAGRIEGAAFAAHTSQFGSVQLRLTDALSLRSQAIQADSTPPSGMWPAPNPNWRGGMGGMMQPAGGIAPAMPMGNFPGMVPQAGRPMPKMDMPKMER
ncbi:MAG TPA: hypothetical protein VE999_19320 [Gemmataceae bacterium]|nr:hypothetical protein [Gemmataceae bacterium]